MLTTLTFTRLCHRGIRMNWWVFATFVDFPGWFPNIYQNPFIFFTWNINLSIKLVFVQCLMNTHELICIIVTNISWPNNGYLDIQLAALSVQDKNIEAITLYDGVKTVVCCLFSLNDHWISYVLVCTTVMSYTCISHWLVLQEIKLSNT